MSIPLADLDPSWIEIQGRRVGVLFECPCCRRSSLAVLFANPVDGGPPHPPDPAYPSPRWRRDGDSFATLTLAPSVDASRAGHWHGFVTNGQCA